ncbi:MAG: hypothetical protein ACRDUV_07365 [Pseudonocardiaceae bacterium]
MSTDPVSEPARRTDDDVRERLAAIDHRLHQISTTIGKLLGQLDEIRADLETLIAALGPGGPAPVHPTRYVRADEVGSDGG